MLPFCHIATFAPAFLLATSTHKATPMCPAFFIDEHHNTETCPVCTVALVAMDAAPEYTPITLEPPIESTELLHA